MAESDADFHDLMLRDDPEFEHVMACVFGIQDHECRTYVELLDAPGAPSPSWPRI